MFTQQLIDFAIFIIQIAENTSLGRTGLNTPGLFSFPYSMITERAFFYDPFAPDSWIRFLPIGIVIRNRRFGLIGDFLSTGRQPFHQRFILPVSPVLLFLVEVNDVVRTGQLTASAANAFIRVMENDPVLILMHGLGRADLNAGRVLTVIAQGRDILEADIRKSSLRVGKVIRPVNVPVQVVFRLAGDVAGGTTDAFV